MSHSFKILSKCGNDLGWIGLDGMHGCIDGYMDEQINRDIIMLRKTSNQKHLTFIAYSCVCGIKISPFSFKSNMVEHIKTLTITCFAH